ncbi:MAG: glycosyltransferase [Bacteroidia bacterium]|nr:glycosyltransferase [Bacteroidia bacterium]
MPRVLILINRLNLGGPAFHVATLTKYLSPEFEMLLVAGTKDDSEESSDYIVKNMGLNFVSLPEMHRSLNPFKDYRSYKALRKMIREFKPDIVHTHAAKAGALGRLAALHEKVPVIIHTFHGHVFHSYFSPFKTKIFLKIERYLAKKSSGIIAISERQKKDLTLKYRVSTVAKVHMIPLGFDLRSFRENISEKREAFRKKYLLEDDEIAIGIIGRLVPVKNHPLFLASAASILKQTKKKVRFFVIGDGESKELLFREAEALGLDYTYFRSKPIKADLTFCSWIKDVDVAISGLDIVALSSHNEGTPVSLIEAQAGDKPVISTNVGGIENVVVKNGTALLVDSNDYIDYAEQLLRLIEDDELRHRLGNNGWEFVREKFHFTRMIKEVSMLYKQLLTKRKSK